METKPKLQTETSPRVFRADTLAEALAEVRRVLGPEAMVLGTRTVRVRGEQDLAPVEKVELLVEDPGPETASPRQDPYTARYAEAQSPAPVDEAAAPESDGLQRLAGLTEDVHELSRDLDRRLREADPYPLSAHLKVSGTTEATLLELADSFERAARGGEPTHTAARRHLSRWLRSTRTVDFEQVQGEHWFFGRAGSGKTSLVLALAAQLRRHGRQVGILALAPQHDGDLQRLQAAAEALDVPAVAAWNAAEAEEARDGFQRLDALLVDTPCHLAHALPGSVPETALRHLVVPLAEDRAVVRDQMRRARGWEPDAIAITQMDLFPRPGRLADLTVEVERPVSFLLGRQEASLVLRLAKGEALLQAALGEMAQATTTAA